MLFVTGDGTQFLFTGAPTQTGGYFLYGTNFYNWSERLKITLVPMFTPPTQSQAVAYFQGNDAQWLMRFGDGQSFIVSSSGGSSPGAWDTVIPVQHAYADDYKITYIYNATTASRTLASIQGPGGRTLTVTGGDYTPSRIDLPDGTYLSYSYADGAWVTVPKLTLFEHRRADDTLISSERYEYNDERLPHYVTDIFGPGNAPIAHYAYDGLGRVISSGKADGTETLTFTYDASVAGQLKTRVMNALGRQTDYVYQYFNLNGRQWVRLTGIVGLASANALADMQSWEIGSNENVTATVDKNGQRTEFVYDSSSRPTTIRRAAGTALQQTETYTWFSTLNLPTKIVAPRLTSDFARDTVGRVTQEKLTDTTSQTVPYSTNGQTRIADYTYDSQGRVLTVDGPRTDVSDVTTNGYDTAGNLTSVTNALGQVVQYSQFDGNGRPGKVFDLNGTESDLTYDGEGRLIERRLKSAAGDVVTTMTYDLEGLLTRVTLADGTWVGFEYDSGQRVAATTNNVGERVEFGYDAMGNLTGQTTKTAGGDDHQTVEPGQR